MLNNKVGKQNWHLQFITSYFFITKPAKIVGGRVEQQEVQHWVPVRVQAFYLGESSRNIFTQAMEHNTNYRKGRKTSFMLKHQNTSHSGQEANFKAKVTGSFSDCLTRQVSEGVSIRRCEVENWVAPTTTVACTEWDI